ncbi:16S rRNA (uracil(1498)-N(3))-methyltransferase [Mycolicibacterium duvalii]|uniref:Ribosomal RNA small subunit methyltransferase E n=1 Tax=Mycolicibacterium duvalii TaxID=39688 RepID=A0A7I7JXM4_9MYCO|nr:16S rRNA (uracil(1498)-N(3))-methyltransferase [Mycolicibacterium duvalii]MCV7367014.1 16S rRNA (uracil(1498)-N(3))-methyltransferase [Mycolicibacterium duvalii]PEG40319.1 16S rRNA (uracil(1498)-N(3))-methyltransferase [Mycolicibacterium duvalii]BBX15862.1 ribosomal RNA small subunit methyltransferase E [Mycolicibacterium duvalii]
MRDLFYVDALPGVGELAVVDGDAGFHATTVRRIRPGEHLDLSDGSGAVAHCVVEEVTKNSLSARVRDCRVIARTGPSVTVVQALPKSDRSELAVELATEAGADAVLAWQAARCVARWDGTAKIEKGLRRWRAVARSAARQSRRPHIPDIDGVIGTQQLVDRIRAAAPGTALVLHESATRGLAGAVPAQAESLMLIVGPEGGVADDELAALTGAGAVAVRLGPTVLRTSTAAAVALGALGVLTRRWA